MLCCAVLRRIWDHVIFNELVTTPEVHDVLVIDGNKNNREKMAEIFFEEFECDRFQTAVPAALVAHDRQAALVLDCGHSICAASPVHDGRVLNYQVPHSAPLQSEPTLLRPPPVLSAFGRAKLQYCTIELSLHYDVCAGVAVLYCTVRVRNQSTHFTLECARRCSERSSRAAR